MKKSFSNADTAAEQLFTIATPKKEQETAPIHPAQPEQQEIVINPDVLPTPPPPPAQPPTIDTRNAFTWKAIPDGELRTRRLQITAKPSIADKAAKMARAKGISVNYLFELLIADAWNKATDNDDK